MFAQSVKVKKMNILTQDIAYRKCNFNSEFASVFIEILNKNNIDLDSNLACYTEQEKNYVINKLREFLLGNYTHEDMLTSLANGIEEYRNGDTEWNKIILMTRQNFVWISVLLWQKLTTNESCHW